MAQKLRKHGKKLEKTSVGCRIDFTILLSMLKVNNIYVCKPHLWKIYIDNAPKDKIRTVFADMSIKYLKNCQSPVLNISTSSS